MFVLDFIFYCILNNLFCYGFSIYFLFFFIKFIFYFFL
jgi:hypothetical protein